MTQKRTAQQAGEAAAPVGAAAKVPKSGGAAPAKAGAAAPAAAQGQGAAASGSAAGAWSCPDAPPSTPTKVHGDMEPWMQAPALLHSSLRERSALLALAAAQGHGLPHS